MAASRMLFSTCFSAWLVALAGCDNAGSPGAFGTPPVTGASGNTIEFRGERACVDCAGIEAWLRLEQRGNERRYTLVEHYLARGRERRFEEQGQWESSGDLLRLRSGAGGERVYAVLADNRLQAVDSRGRPLAAAADDVMVPTSYSNDE
jgi:hypothetical protein